jgi:hypothetical protein
MRFFIRDIPFDISSYKKYKKELYAFGRLETYRPGNDPISCTIDIPAE